VKQEDSMSTTKQSAGLFPKAVLAGIGAAAATLDWTRAFLARAIERGEMAEMEAKETGEYAAPGQPAPAPSTVQTVKAEPMREADQPAARLRLPWVATRSDLSELNRQLDRLEAQVTALEQQQANSATEAASEAP
jgi:polyhydroxyalkanoate synthesis regulator phasin